MNIAAFPYTIPLIMVAVASIAIAVTTWKRRFAAGAVPLILAFAGHALWSLGSAGTMLSADRPVEAVFTGLTQLGILSIPTGALAFALEYSTLKRKLPAWGWALLLVEPLAMVALSAAWGISGSLGMRSLLGYPSQVPVAGGYLVLRQVHLTYAYLAYLAAALLMLRGLIRASRFFAGQGIVLLAGLMFPWLANVLEINHINPVAPLELTPLAFMAAQAAFAWGVFQYRLLDILPLARSSVVERLADGVVVLDALHRITDLNRAAERITGCLSRRSIGKPVDSVLHLDCADLLALIGSGSENHAEVVLGERFYDLRVTPIHQRGQPVGSLVLLHDISDQKELQAALLASEEKYRRVVERSNDGIAIIQDGMLCYSNPQLASLLGYSLEELPAIPLFNLIAAEDRAAVRERYTRRLAGEPVPSRYGAFLLRKNGEPLEVEVSSGLMDYEGRPAVLVFIRDVSEQKRASQELEKFLSLLKATIESTADGFLVVGQDQMILSNRRFDEMWRLPSNWPSLPGHEEPFRLLSVHVADPDAFLQRVRELASSPEKVGHDLIALKDGRIFERYAMPYRIGGNIAGKVWNFRDVTGQKQAEEALQQANDRLTQTVRELELHNREVSLLSDMGDMLHSCSSLDEAYIVVSDFAHRLFPEQSGALYIFSHSRNLAEAVVTWGDIPLQVDFPPGACWALRRGRLHIVTDPLKGIRCRHSEGAAKLPTVCVPLIAQSETMGIFHLSGQPERNYKAWEKLVTAVAETTAMSLANLRLRESLQMQSIRDPLTGLYNRRYMEQALELEVRRASRYHRSVGVLMIDIDHFKDLNDRRGHKAGDQLLQAFSKYLLENLREEDFACRYGGEEFLVILPEAALENCRVRAEQLRQGVLDMDFSFDDKPVKFTISVGVASYPENGRSAEVVVVAADAALYNAKRSGRDRVVVSTQSIPTE